MGVEVAGSEVPLVNGDAKDLVHDMENGNENASEPIVFGSQGVDEQQPKGEAENVSNAKDAADEWPAEPQVHSFWVVKYRSYEDPKLKAEIEKLENDFQKTNAQITQIFDQLNAKKPVKDQLLAELSSLGEERSQYQEFINQKRSQMKPLQDALGDLRGPGREKGINICSSEEELNGLIRSLEYHIQHESVSLKEEKQILREIKELEATRPKVIANAAMRAKVQESMGQKEAIQDQVKLLGSDLDGVRKQKAAVQEKREQLQAKLVPIRDQMNKLYSEAETLKEKKNTMFKSLKSLRTQRDEGNKVFYANRTILSRVKEHAAKKDVKALEELVNSEVEIFLSQWNTSRDFRSDYEKRILLSLDMRQLSRDGSMRNFDEKPIVMAESPVPSEAKIANKATNKPQKEDPKSTSKAENLPAEKAQNESRKGSTETKVISERSMEEEVFVVEKPKKDISNGSSVDAAKLKEKKKEEEKEKQKQALERKKKLQEKAAAKAALRAQKEAEKKQKDREKKLKKKEVSSDQPTNEEESSDKPAVDESENNVEDAVGTVAPPKTKEQKENALRHRKPAKPRGTVPKALLKKKKAANYWLYASAGAAAVVVLLLLFLGYNYIQKAQVAS